MWKLKILQGLPSQTFTLKDGANIVGRLPASDIILASSGISKRHAQILVKDGVCSVTDLRSSNGTFVNGSRVQDRILKSGDRIAFHNIVVELQSNQIPNQIPKQIPAPAPAPFPQAHGSLALNSHSLPQPMGSPQTLGQLDSPAPAPRSLPELAKYYVDNVILPGVYKINEHYPTKNIIAGFILLFAVVVTLLSTVPMSTLMEQSTQREAQRRALTIARQLAAVSEKALSMASETSIRTDFAEAEDGVTTALVVAQEDGHIIAPMSKAQTYSNEEFVARARKHEDTFVDQTSSTTVGASVPVRVFSPETGQQGIAAFAIILYKMDSLDWGNTAGLFARVLLVALLAAALLFFFIYRVVTEPIRQATIDLDKALRGETNIINPKYVFDVFNGLINNINSALARMGSPQDAMKPQFNRSGEAANLIRILSDAAIGLDGQAKIISVNASFEDLTGMRQLTLQNQSLDILQDQALKLNLEDLFQKCLQQPQQISTGQLDMNGIAYELDAQSVSDGQEVFYVIITLKRRVQP